jgi:hypothetical protein
VIAVKGYMELVDAERECPSPQDLQKTRCGPCGAQVMVHCSSCGISVTGCVCTMTTRKGYTQAVAVFGQERVDRAIARQNDMERVAREQAIRSGLWVPGANN